MTCSKCIGCSRGRTLPTLQSKPAATQLIQSFRACFPFRSQGGAEQVFVLTVMMAVPNRAEDGGIDEVAEILSESRHRTVETAEKRMRQMVRGEATEFGETGWVPVGALEWAREHPDRPILIAIIEAAELEWSTL